MIPTGISDGNLTPQIRRGHLPSRAVFLSLIVLAGCGGGRVETAHELLKQGDYLSARTIYERRLCSNVRDFPARYGNAMSWCAEALYKTDLGIASPQDWYPAIYHMHLAQQIDPQNSEVQRTLAVFHFNCGAALKQTGDPVAAVMLLEESVRYDSTLVKAYNLLGSLYHQQADYIQARRCYRKVLDLQPDYAMAWFNLGVLEWAMGDFAAAGDNFGRAVQLSPGNESFTLWHDKALLRTGTN